MKSIVIAFMALALCIPLAGCMTDGMFPIVSNDNDGLYPYYDGTAYVYVDPGDYYYYHGGSYYHHHHSREIDVMIVASPSGYHIIQGRPNIPHYAGPRRDMHRGPGFAPSQQHRSRMAAPAHPAPGPRMQPQNRPGPQQRIAPQQQRNAPRLKMAPQQRAPQMRAPQQRPMQPRMAPQHRQAPQQRMAPQMRAPQQRSAPPMRQAPSRSAPPRRR